MGREAGGSLREESAGMRSARTAGDSKSLSDTQRDIMCLSMLICTTDTHLFILPMKMG